MYKSAGQKLPAESYDNLLLYDITEKVNISLKCPLK